MAYAVARQDFIHLMNRMTPRNPPMQITVLADALLRIEAAHFV